MFRFTPPSIERAPRPGGGFVLRSRHPLPPYPRCLGEHLARWAAAAPTRALYAEREAPRVDAPWRHVTYADALAAARALGQALLDLGCSARRPLAILAGNSIDHALLALAAMHVGVPVAPISPAYALLSSDHAKLRAMIALLAPGAIYVGDRGPFARALAAIAPLVGATPMLDAADVAALRARTQPTAAVDAAFARIDGDTVAKLLFTSGSTGTPKAVINTQRMLCANQAQLAAGWPGLADRPPVLVDWLPWSHTFGANHNANLVLAHGGTLYLDHGKPAPGAFELTLANLREVPSTHYFNVPRGFDLLVGHLEDDAALRATFFRELDVVFYAAAALSPATWGRLAAVAARAGRDAARPLAMTSAWGSTETSPLVTQVCFPIDRAGVIGTPVPGVELAFAPVGDQLELRVAGPNVAPGYLGADGAIEPLPRDELGCYPMGDAGALADPDDPDRGVVFAGRTAENFKLASGTWVHVGATRLALLAAASPAIADAAITGHDREELGALVFLAPGHADDDVTRAHLAAALVRLAEHPGASASSIVARVAILAEPPGIDAGEITDKGYLNQRATLARRAAHVAALYAGGDHVIAPRAPLAFRRATAADAERVVALVERGYRGEASRAGWTTEADLLDGQRTDRDDVLATIARADSVVILAERAGALVGCANVAIEKGAGYFGMFAVVPTLQGGGLGSAVLAEAERVARDELAQEVMRMTVIDVRAELIAFYERRGYARTGEHAPFPYGDPRFGLPKRDDLRFAVLAKRLR